MKFSDHYNAIIELRLIQERLERFEDIHSGYSKTLLELDTSGEIDVVSDLLKAISDKFEAARKGLKLAGKLPPGASRAKHTKRILTNMNVIRGELRRAEKELESLT